MAVQYQYEPLKHGEIRVLTIVAGRFGDPILSRLEHFDLYEAMDRCEERFPLASEWDSFWSLFDSQAHGYEAISYVWGSKELSHQLYCPDASHLHITESLHTAFQYLRCKDRDRRVWADAVCINQSDLAERAAQVAMMAYIFQCARRTLVWLGEAQPRDTLAFALLHAADAVDWEHQLRDDDANSTNITASKEDPLLEFLAQEP